MNRRIQISLSLLPVFAQIPGCHYWIDATPKIIVSSEPFAPPPPETYSLRPLPSGLRATVEIDPEPMRK